MKGPVFGLVPFLLPSNRDKRIFDLWLACYSQDEIANSCGIDQGDLSRMVKEFMEIGNLAESHKAAATDAVDFDAPIYMPRSRS